MRKHRRRFGGTKVRLKYLASSPEISIFTTLCKLSCMLVLLHHGKQSTSNSVLHLLAPQLHTQQHLVLWVPKARYHST